MAILDIVFLTASAAKQTAIKSQPERFLEIFDSDLEEGIHALIDK